MSGFWAQDRLLGIYPEGTRSPNGTMYRGKTGLARMALESQVPIIPVAMINTFEIQPPGTVRPRLRRVGVRFGEPLDFSRYEGLEDDRFILRSVTDEVMYALMSLSGQEYVDMYASRAKELIAEGAVPDSAALSRTYERTESVDPVFAALDCSTPPRIASPVPFPGLENPRTTPGSCQCIEGFPDADTEAGEERGT